MTRVRECIQCGEAFEPPILKTGSTSNRATCSEECRYRRSHSSRRPSYYAPDGFKACPLCSTVKPLDDYDRYTTGARAGRTQSYCRDCRRADARKRKRIALGVPLDATTEDLKAVHAHPVGYTYEHRGYLYEKVGKGSHHRADVHGYVPQHILVAEDKYGIKITRDFTVHHINGDRADNRPENLDLRWGNHGKGADVIPGLLRSPEVRAIARAVLAQYPDD